jgi:membrane fusion protein, multidrug efflux system
MQLHTKHIVRLGIAGTGLAVFLLPSLLPSPTPPVAQETPGRTSLGAAPIPVEVAPVTNGELVQFTRAHGILRARRSIDIAARIGSDVIDVRAMNGRHVARGDTLLLLDDREFHAAYERARTTLLGAQIEYRTLSQSPFLESQDSATIRRQTMVDAGRMSELDDLFRRGILTREAYDREQRDARAALAYVRADRGDVIANKSGLAVAEEICQRAQMDLDAAVVTAPCPGTIANSSLVAGMRVHPGMQLLTVVDLSTLAVEADLLEGDASKIRPGQPARVSVPAVGGADAAGFVVAVNPLVQEGTRTVKVTVSLEGDFSNRSRMYPGMYATVAIATALLRDRLLVRREAVLIRDDRAVAFTLRGNRARWHYLEIGESNDEFFEVRSGVGAADTVIVGGHAMLAHDATVLPVVRHE